MAHIPLYSASYTYQSHFYHLLSNYLTRISLQSYVKLKLSHAFATLNRQVIAERPATTVERPARPARVEIVTGNVAGGLGRSCFVLGMASWWVEDG